MQRLTLRTPTAQLATLARPAVRRTPQITAPVAAPQPPASQEPPARPHAQPDHAKPLGQLLHGLACCSPALLLQLAAAGEARASRVCIDVPDWLHLSSPADFLLHTPALTLGVVVVLLGLLPRMIKASVRYLALPAIVVLVGWVAISYPQQTAGSIEVTLQFVHDHPVAASAGLLASAALLVGPQVLTGGVALGAVLLLAAKAGFLELPPLPSLPSLPRMGAATEAVAKQVAGTAKQLASRAFQGGSAAIDDGSSGSSSGSSGGGGAAAGAGGSASEQQQQELQRRAAQLASGAKDLGGKAGQLLQQQSSGLLQRLKSLQAPEGDGTGPDAADGSRTSSSSSSAATLRFEAEQQGLSKQAAGLADNARELGGRARALVEQQRGKLARRFGSKAGNEGIAGAGGSGASTSAVDGSSTGTSSASSAGAGRADGVGSPGDGQAATDVVLEEVLANS